MLNLKNGTVIVTVEKFETAEDAIKLANDFAPEAEGTIEVYINNGSVGMLTVRDAEGNIFDYVGKIGEVNLEVGDEDSILNAKATNFAKLKIENPKIYWPILKTAVNGFTLYNNGNSKLRKFAKDSK